MIRTKWQWQFFLPPVSTQALKEPGKGRSAKKSAETVCIIPPWRRRQ